MTADGMQQNSTPDDFQAHRRNYDGFITILKRSAIAVAIVTIIVVLIISR